MSETDTFIDLLQTGNIKKQRLLPPFDETWRFITIQPNRQKGKHRNWSDPANDPANDPAKISQVTTWESLAC